LSELSAHADQSQLVSWASHFKPPRLTILTHGELHAAMTLERILEERLKFTVAIAEKGEVFELKEVAR
jgi:metallo-beta-lactamase family protein